VSSRRATIGVIGAGASGLAAANALRLAGYPSVTVLEREDRVGGKCETFFHEGRSYELGAGAVTGAYHRVRALMDEVGVRARLGASGAFVDLETRRESFIPDALRRLSPLSLGAAGARLALAMWRQRRVLSPGFAGVAPELCRPFTEWASLHRLDAVPSLIEPWFTGFGYGYLDETPAAYVLKYLALFRFPVGELLATGYQGLWQRVASSLDVRLKVQIRSITRGEGITVETDRERFSFDVLIVTCPPAQALEVLDASDEERDLLSRVKVHDYHAVAATVERGPRARYGFIPRHLRRDRAGHVVFWYRRWKDRDVVLYYCLPPPGTDIERSIEMIREDVGRMGGRVGAIHRRRAWRYFPHVSPGDMQSGYYERMEAMQGRRSTFFAGELLAFSTVENVVAYAEDVVGRHFVE
jgi:predicted NAD/FAD-binding protein